MTDLRLLRRRGVVEPDEALAADRLAQDRKLALEDVRVERLGVEWAKRRIARRRDLELVERERGGRGRRVRRRGGESGVRRAHVGRGGARVEEGEREASCGVRSEERIHGAADRAEVERRGERSRRLGERSAASRRCAAEGADGSGGGDESAPGSASGRRGRGRESERAKSSFAICAITRDIDIGSSSGSVGAPGTRAPRERHAGRRATSRTGGRASRPGAGARCSLARAAAAPRPPCQA